MSSPLPEDYVKYIEDRATSLSRVGDALTSTDERINYVVIQLESLRGSIDVLTSMFKEQEMLIGETTQIRFQETLQPLTGDRFIKDCPFDAIITSVCYHFPPGCEALIGMSIGHSGKQCFPREGTIALDATTPVFPTYERVERSEVLWCEIRNADTEEAHTLTIILTLQERL